MSTTTQPAANPSDEIVIRVPGVWQALLNTEFPDDLAGMQSGPAEALDDPTAYYDDSREAVIVIDQGTVLTVSLSSGQGNYYGYYTLTRTADGGLSIGSNQFEHLATLEREVVEALRKYQPTAHLAERVRFAWPERRWYHDDDDISVRTILNLADERGVAILPPELTGRAAAAAIAMLGDAWTNTGEPRPQGLGIPNLAGNLHEIEDLIVLLRRVKRAVCRHYGVAVERVRLTLTSYGHGISDREITGASREECLLKLRGMLEEEGGMDLFIYYCIHFGYHNRAGVYPRMGGARQVWRHIGEAPTQIRSCNTDQEAIDWFIGQAAADGPHWLTTEA